MRSVLESMDVEEFDQDQGLDSVDASGAPDLGSPMVSGSEAMGLIGDCRENVGPGMEEIQKTSESLESEQSVNVLLDHEKANSIDDCSALEEQLDQVPNESLYDQNEVHLHQQLDGAGISLENGDPDQRTSEEYAIINTEE